jgi:large conductance mechanosensitive channel
MGFISDFKGFLMRGNVLDLATGVVLGGAFGKIVTAVVDKVLMPIVSLAMGGGSFADKKIILKDAILKADGSVDVVETAIGWGAVLQFTIEFVFVALFIYLILKSKDKFSKAEVEAPVGPTADQVLLAEIRDALRK